MTNKQILLVMSLCLPVLVTGCGGGGSGGSTPVTLSIDSVQIVGTVTDNLATIGSINVNGSTVPVVRGGFSSTVNAGVDANIPIMVYDPAMNAETITIEIR